jgi:serine/threonine protein kinase
MSPEQAQGRPVDARSDIFSAAAVSYFIVTGRSAFGSADLRKILQSILRAEPQPLTDAEAPEPLRRIIMKGLAKAPEDRYQRFADMRADLERALRTYTGATYRILEAGLARYRQTLALIEERRALSRVLGTADADETASSEDLAQRFPLFAAHVNGGTVMDLTDRESANAALQELQLAFNTEQAKLLALQAQAPKGRRPE